MRELSSAKLGPFSLFTIETGRFRLDGGAMFGVVPKTLWERKIEADGRNRIPMAMRCLLIQSHNTGKIYLVDNGIGTKFNKKMEEIYQVDHEHSNIVNSLTYHGFEPEDVTDIIFTHLHFDHCGGTTYYADDGSIRHTFPKARYHVTKTHWETATSPNAREKASFYDDNIGPIGEWEQFRLVEDGHVFEEELSTLVVNGHTIGQQLPFLHADGKTVVFAADLLPTAAHVPLPWIMGYDMRPINTLQEKERILNTAAEEQWYFYLEHDARYEVIQIGKKDSKFEVSSYTTLNAIS